MLLVFLKYEYHYSLNSAKVWKVLSKSLYLLLGLCIQDIEYANPQSRRILTKMLRMGEHVTVNEPYGPYKLSRFQAPSLDMRSQSPRNPELSFQSLLPVDFHLPGKELEWEKRNSVLTPQHKSS